jgi:5,10-methylene-tetrahydrofolate dehydrogenase/methenyl tetrahydrofolate cyclohydrolase
MKKILNVYYDNPNTASDMYLKYLSKDCEKNGIEVKVIDNLNDWYKKDIGATLVLKPTKIHTLEPSIQSMKFNDSIAGNVDNPSATATGIYNYITKTHPNREMVVGVIGRGNVGKELLDMLIDYGYTVIEMNSKTESSSKEQLANCCDILVGLSSQDGVLKKQQCDYLTDVKGCVLIDASNNFQTTKKLRCGKWTRQVVIDRINRFYDYNSGVEIAHQMSYLAWDRAEYENLVGDTKDI